MEGVFWSSVPVSLIFDWLVYAQVFELSALHFPGVMEINQTIQALRSMNLGKVEIMPLHAQLSSQEQKRVFIKLPADVRKIVVATNVAETSITIDDITVVVDTGKVKETQFEAERGMQLLVEVLTRWVSEYNFLKKQTFLLVRFAVGLSSKAASRQRKGRAGRTKPGKVSFFSFSFCFFG